MDAVSEATSIGISADRAVAYDYTSKGVDAVYATMDCFASATRSDDIAALNCSLSDLYASCNADALEAVSKVTLM